MKETPNLEVPMPKSVIFLIGMIFVLLIQITVRNAVIVDQKPRVVTYCTREA